MHTLNAPRPYSHNSPDHRYTVDIGRFCQITLSSYTSSLEFLIVCEHGEKEATNQMDYLNETHFPAREFQKNGSISYAAAAGVVEAVIGAIVSTDNVS